MPEGTDAAVVTQDVAGTRIDIGAIPDQQPATLNEFQKAFTQHYEGNDLMKQFAASENPFKAVADKFAEASQASPGLSLPTEKSTPEEVAAYRKAVGAFEKAEDYKYDPASSDDESIKKLLPADAPFIKAFQEIAAKTHMPEGAWKELVGAYNQMMVEDAKTHVEVSTTALNAIKENWSKTHGAEAPKVETVFQKYFANSTPAEAAILQTLSPEQMTALGSAVYRQEKRLGSEDKIDAGNLGSDTMGDLEYVTERSKLLSEQRKLASTGKAWSPEADAIAKQLADLSTRFEKSKALTK
jgi:hypothetical protein